MNCQGHTGTWEQSQDSPVLCSYSPALTTVEGLISRAISGLEQDQPTRRVSWDILIAAAQGIITYWYMHLRRVFSFLRRWTVWWNIGGLLGEAYGDAIVARMLHTEHLLFFLLPLHQCIFRPWRQQQTMYHYLWKASPPLGLAMLSECSTVYLLWHKWYNYILVICLPN